MLERRSSRNGLKTQSKRWPDVVYLNDNQRQCPIGIWCWTSLCNTRPWGFHMEKAHGSAPGGRSHWMGAWGGAVGLRKAAAHRCRMQLLAFITGVRLFLCGAQESCALQLCNEPFPFLLFLGSQFLFSSSSTSKKRIFNNWLGRACYPEAMGGSGAAPIVTSCCQPGQVLIPLWLFSKTQLIILPDSRPDDKLIHGTN